METITFNKNTCRTCGCFAYDGSNIWEDNQCYPCWETEMRGITGLEVVLEIEDEEK